MASTSNPFIPIPHVPIKNTRTKRELNKRAPKLVENIKNAMFIRGTKCSQIIVDAMRDMKKLKQPDCVLFSRKNDTKPFEDASSIEFLGVRNDCSLFMFGSSTKKRPNSIILGRLFNGRVLDMMELGVQAYTPMSEFSGNKPALGSKPCFVFHGDQFEQQEPFAKFKNLIVDFFRGQVVDSINLVGIDHVISCTCAENTIYFRHYTIVFKRSGKKVPKVELAPCGPSLDFVIKRTQFASQEVIKMATRVPKELLVKPKKNIKKSSVGEKTGTIHVGQQDLSQLNSRRVKALKRNRADKSENSGKKRKTE